MRTQYWKTRACMSFFALASILIPLVSQGRTFDSDAVQKMVTAALNAPWETLRTHSGPISCESPFDPGNPGYGKTSEDAVTHAQLLCIKSRCATVGNAVVAHLREADLNKLNQMLAQHHKRPVTQEQYQALKNSMNDGKRRESNQAACRIITDLAIQAHEVCVSFPYSCSQIADFKFPNPRQSNSTDRIKSRKSRASPSAPATSVPAHNNETG